jgi:antirestriction protein ArdC
MTKRTSIGRITRAETPRADIYERITARIVSELEQGVRPWTKPWSAENTAGRISRPLRHNSEPYRGINVVLLWMEAVARGFTCPIWTYRQAQALGGQVRKGETGSLVVYANRITKAVEDPETGEETETEIPFMKGYTVFCCEQIGGLPEHFYGRPAPVLDPVPRNERADAFFAATGADIRHGGNRAFYTVERDVVQMPPFETFRDADSYVATLGHECIHWTRHPSRLDRSFGRRRWGDEGYAREELTAELGAAFLRADLGVALEPREDHAQYVASWLEVLRGDKRAVFQAAAQAERAVAFLHGLQPGAVLPDSAGEHPAEIDDARAAA